MRHPYFAPIACIVLGLVVIAGSSVVQRLPKTDAGWTLEQEAELREAADQLVEFDQNEVAPDDPQRQDVQTRYDALYEELKQARGGSLMAAMILQMLGVGLGLVGSVWLILRQNQAEDRQAERG
ncbi:hypothetical protein Pla123a_33110 [Posidoniimonas polymericola]|uniref:Uncharacterized protein n=1 Tax=Posidoniimonas polymericola TaxID=2528002 RepID=A0A5C5YH30_9BACT|nr:hypothetical protein [Posidoniimonas polymericola]TWT74488.1 hypothetical protein Pla123a_33110 [Posidoniimonas polymericola]